MPKTEDIARSVLNITSGGTIKRSCFTTTKLYFYIDAAQDTAIFPFVSSQRI